MKRVPQELRWLFWNVDVDALELDRDADVVLARVLERGRLEDVRWLVRTYGLERIHEFFRAGASPEVSRRTRLFWRAALGAREERWPEPPDWRKSSSAPWID